jgi:hypothetical protein
VVEADPRDPRAKEGDDPLADGGGSGDLEDVGEGEQESDEDEDTLS